MKINSLNSNVTFGRALTKDELEDYSRVLGQAKSKVAGEGKSILIVHDVCLPQNKESDTGIGHITTDTSTKFFDFAKNYWGINTIEVLPPGEIQLRHGKGFYNSYNGSALSLGSQQINLELLTQPDYDSILPVSEFDSVVAENSRSAKEGLVNYENVVGANTPFERALKVAHDNFKVNASDEHKKEFEDYKKENADWLERKALYSVLKQKNGGKDWTEWPRQDSTLYDSVNNKKCQAKKNEYKEKLLEKNADAVDFYMFKQYIADKHLAQGRKNLNEKLKMKLVGDCLIGFSQDEVWAYKDAFKKDEDGKIVYVGDPDWKLPALNYDNITEDGSASNTLLKKKVSLFAKRYDGIRFDCSWAYVNPKLSDGSKVNMKGSVLDIIEDTVKKVKGEKFNKQDLIHEFEADPKDFALTDFNGKVKSYLRDRVKVITSAHMGEKYGSTVAMEKMGATPESYIIGVGNHDPQPLKQIANNIPEIQNGKYSYRKKGQEQALQKIFGVSAYEVSSPEGFSQYKFAEPLLAQNQMVFYMDVLGRSERFDSQQQNGTNNYRYRIPVDYAQKYQEAVQSGFGYNPMDGYSKVFKKKGLDNELTSLYNKVVKYRDILKEKEGETEPDIDVAVTPSMKRKLALGTAVGVAALVLGVIAGADSGLQNQFNEGNFTIKI